MKTLKLLFLFFVLSIASCKESSTNKPKAFYDTVHRLLDKAEPPLNELADSMIAIQKHLRADNNYRADINRLNELLQKSINLNQSVIDSINLFADYSPDINLKGTALNYAGDWQTTLENDFTQWVNELPVVMENKADYFEELMRPSLERTQESSDKLTEKNREYKKTFKF